MTSTRWRGWLVAALLLTLGSAVQAAEQRLLIPPRLTDDRLAEAEPPHLVIYERDAQNAPLLVWLPGTGGKPAPGPQLFYGTVLQQGYRLVALSYLDAPAVSQVCTAATLAAQPACAEQMRQQRVWGQPQSGLVADRPEDAIVPRLTRLLQFLVRSDAAGHWEPYLDGDEPRWDRIVLAGQSQGGGMAAFMAQTRRVAGVIMFSGGWDHRPGGDIAEWYSRPSLTPPRFWHASFHTQEPQAATLARIYRRLGVPADQIHALSLPVRGKLAHGEGITNPAYQPLWEQMLAFSLVP
jgi:hypothetical protein